MTDTKKFEDAAAEGIIRYSMVWEDHLLLERGLEVGADDHVLCVTSAGDNALALLLAGAKRVTAVDLNASQTAMLELQLAALRRLEDPLAFAQLMGARPCADRLALYDRVRPALPEGARRYWDASGKLLVAGLCDTGRLEQYIAVFRAKHLAPIAAALGDLLRADSLEAQAERFAAIATPALQQAVGGYFNRETMADKGRDPSQFRFVDKVDVADYFWQRFRWVCTAIPVRGNFYLERLLTGGYAELEAGPPHLRPSTYAKLRAAVDRVTCVTGSIGDVLAELPEGGLDKAGLSNIFEYLSHDDSQALMGQLAAKLRRGGRMAYWNLLVDRQSGEALRDRLQPLTELSHRLHEQDRSFFYSAFRVEERR